MFEPRPPLRRDRRDALNEQLVLRVPPNTPTIAVGPSRPVSEPAPSTPVFQLDGADNAGFQLEQGPVVQVIGLQDNPVGVHLGDLEAIQPVSCCNGDCRYGVKINVTAE